MKKTFDDFKKEFTRLCKKVLKTDCDHFWIDMAAYGFAGLYITGEFAEEINDTYVFCYLTNDIDWDGYCFGCQFLDAYIDMTLDDESIGKYAEYFFNNLENYIPWFDENGYLQRRITKEQAEQAYHSGQCFNDVENLRNELNFSVNRIQGIEYLKSTGGYSKDELEHFSDDYISSVVLWLVCGEITEQEEEGCWVDVCIRN